MFKKQIEIWVKEAEQQLKVAQAKYDEKKKNLSSADQQKLETDASVAAEKYDFEAEKLRDYYRKNAIEAAANDNIDSSLSALSIVAKIDNGMHQSAKMEKLEEQRQAAEKQLENFESSLESYRKDVEHWRNQRKIAKSMEDTIGTILEEAEKLKNNS